MGLPVLGTFVMNATNNGRMTRSRGLITFTERERIAGKDSVEDSKRYQAISRVRRRIHEEVVEEVALLREHHPELLEELQEVVCEDE
jgi:hypothetical protein